MTAEFVFVGGRIYTLDVEVPDAAAVAVAGGRISAVGTIEEVLEHRGPKTTVVELDGRTLLPGFYDAHQHQVYAGLAKRQVDGHVDSIEELRARIGRAADERNPGSWIEGGGYDESRMSERRQPTRGDLDQAAPDRPCFVTRTCGHALVANTLALSAAGIDRATPDPQGGWIDRDPATGEPTGLLREAAMQLIRRVVPQPSRGELEEAILDGAAVNLRHGVTSVWEPSVEPNHVEAYEALERSGRLPIRVTMAQKKVMRSGEDVPIPQSFRRERLSLVAVKLFQDGAIGSRTAALSSPYVGQPDNYGILQWPQPELDALVADISGAGLQASIHAIGDEAIRSALSAISAALRAAPRHDHRHRIEHCGLPLGSLPHDLCRLSVVPVLQPSFLHFHGDTYFENLGAARSERLYPVKTLLEAGSIIAGSSDGPVVPNLNPLHGIRTAMTRASATGRVLAAGEAISLEEGLRLYTCNAAFAAHEEQLKGTLAPGKAADLLILGADLAHVPTDALDAVEAELVLVGGEVAFAR
jgi:predicted amidohydrolase YtcJ